MDQLAEIAGNLLVAETRVCLYRNDTVHLQYACPQDIPSSNSVPPVTAVLPSPFSEQRAMRRPMLNALRQIDSIRVLVPFFSHVSIASYESVYMSGGIVDWEAVEKGIMADMFDGKS
jgi:hypothetical protein